MVEQWFPKPKVKGSNPFSPDKKNRWRRGTEAELCSRSPPGLRPRSPAGEAPPDFVLSGLSH